MSSYVTGHNRACPDWHEWGQKMQRKGCLGQLQGCRTFVDGQLTKKRKGIHPLCSEKREKRNSKLPNFNHIKLNPKVISISIIRKEKKTHKHIYGNNDKSINHSQGSKEITMRKGTNRNVNF